MTTIKNHSSLLLNSTRADVVFVVSKDEIIVPAHHFILAKESEFFKNNMNTSKIEIVEFLTIKKIEMVNIQVENIKEFLCYIYTNDFELTHLNVGQLHSLSSLFKVEKLLKMCSLYLRDEISLLQACSLPEFSYKVAAHILRYPFPDRELELLAVNLNKRHIELILTSSFSHTDEIKLFNLCMAWSKIECVRKGIVPTPKYQREQLNDLFYEIRFKAMTNEDLKELIEEFVEMFQPEELIEFICRKDAITWKFRLDPRLTVNCNFCKFETIYKHNTPEKIYKFSFSSNKNIMLTSVQVLIPDKNITKKTDFYQMDVFDTSSDLPIESKSHLILKNNNFSFKEFDWPGILIRENIIYSLYVTFNEASIGIASQVINRKVVEMGITFTAYSEICPFGNIGFSIIN